MTRMAPRSNVVGTHNAGKDDYRPAGRTRVVAWVVGGMLLLHLLAVGLILSIAKWAAADTEARLATLPWAFPKTEVATLPAPPQVVAAKQAPATVDWLSQANRKDASAPWSYDRAGNVVWK